MKKVMALDPGITGGIAMLSDDGLIAERMPIVAVDGKNQIDLAALGGYMAAWQPDVVWIEKQQAMPKQGVSSTFRTGLNYGVLVGFIQGRGIPLEIVAHGVWKRVLGVPADKRAARAVATRLFPAFANLWALARDDGIAEAAMIALYGSKRT